MKKLLCLGFSGSELDQSLWGAIDKLVDERILASEIDDNLDADGLFVKLGAKINRDLMNKMPNLKYIGMLGTGYGGIDTKYAASKNVTVANIADYATEAVAEFSLGVLLEYMRDIAKAKTQAGAGDYSDDFTGTEIKGKTFGIIGLGNIGLRTAELARAFGADVIYWSQHRKDDAEKAGINYAEDVLAKADIISVNLALNADTENYFDQARVASIKRGAIVINLSPMELFDFDALVERLKKNDITFMLDHSDEMSAEQLEALQPLDNCIIYPPIAYLTNEAGRLKKRIYVDNLKNYLSGKPTNKVN